MLTTSTDLRDNLVALHRDIQDLPGRRVALLGFRDPNARRVDDNIRAFLEAPGWRLVDLRDATAQVPAALRQALAAPIPALLLDATATLTSDAALLIRAFHDSHNTVDWSDGAQSSIPSDRILYVIAAGARCYEELPAILKSIDFMTFIQPPA